MNRDKNGRFAKTPAPKFQVGDLVDCDAYYAPKAKCAGGKIAKGPDQDGEYEVTGNWSCGNVWRFTRASQMRHHVPAKAEAPAPKEGTPEWAEAMGKAGHRVRHNRMLADAAFIRVVNGEWKWNNGADGFSPLDGKKDNVWSIYTPPAEEKPAMPETLSGRIYELAKSKTDALEAAKREAMSNWKGNKSVQEGIEEGVEIGFRAGQKAAQATRVATSISSNEFVIATLEDAISAKRIECNQHVANADKASDEIGKLGEAIAILKGGV